jgi:hypothetical protein
MPARILLLLVAMMRSMERQRDHVAGLCFALAGLLRVFPFLLFLYLIIQRRWRVLSWALIGTASGILVTLAIFKPNKSLSFINGIRLLTDSRLINQSTNISMRALVTRLVWFLSAGHSPAEVTSFARLAVLVTDVALLGVTIWATAALGPRKDPDWRAFSLWIMTSVLLSPVAWLHYLVLLLIPFVQLAKAAATGNASKRAEWSAIASYLFIGLFPWLFAKVMSWDPHDGQPTLLIRLMYMQCMGAALLGYLAAYWFTVDVQLSHPET